MTCSLLWRVEHRWACRTWAHPGTTSPQPANTDFINFFLGRILFPFYVRYSTLLHLPPLRFQCVGGCWDRTQDSCDYGIRCQTDALTTRLDLIQWMTAHQFDHFPEQWYVSAFVFIRILNRTQHFTPMRIRIWIQALLWRWKFNVTFLLFFRTTICR